MAYRCEICGKGKMAGLLVSHSKQRTHRVYKPNLHQVKTLVNGVRKSIKVCTKCLRKIKEKVAQVAKVERVPKVAAIPQVEPVVQAPREVKVKTTTIEELLKETAHQEETKEPVKKKRGRPRKQRKIPKR